VQYIVHIAIASQSNANMRRYRLLSGLKRYIVNNLLESKT